MIIQNCPILYPTSAEFKDFYKFVEKCDQLYKDTYGMVKVVPPKDWKPNSFKTKEYQKDLIVHGPIQQNIFGKGGIYECLHIQKKSMTLQQYKQRVLPFDKITDGLTADQIQAMFWKNIVFSPPLYGADILNTLMDSKAGTWNMNDLDSLLKYSVGTKCKGVNLPYNYIGSWKTLFCWHKEDLDLSAINYIHEGKSKFWYSIPANQANLMQNVTRKVYPQHYAKCPQFLRHKTFLINPYNLKKMCPQLNITKTEHKKNEFILVFGGAYHCGFNFGFNIAQAINYGTLSWLKQVTDSKYCKCSKSSVKASLLQLYHNLSQSPISKTRQFYQFKQKVFQQVQKQVQEQQKQNEQRQIKSLYSRKIKKNKKVKQNLTKLNYKGQQYEIDNWACCDKCHVWRKTKKPLKEGQRFTCKNISKSCGSRQKIQKDYITL